MWGKVSSVDTPNCPNDGLFRNDSRPPVTVHRDRVEVSSGVMLRLVLVGPMSDEDRDPIELEATAPPSMTADLAAALAQLVRAALARRAGHSERAA